MTYKEEDGKRDIKEREEPAQDLADLVEDIFRGHIPGITARKGESAVLIPLIKKSGDYHILYEQRAASLLHQPGEICFPGGRIEEGESHEEAAIRETEEELCIGRENIRLLASLDARMGPNGASIWPVAALLEDYHGTFSRDEVERVFTIPLSWFMSHEPKRYITHLVTVPGEDFPYQLIPGGRGYPFRKKKHEILFYETEEAVIWGLTAGITDSFLQSVREYYPCSEYLDIRDEEGRLTGRIKARELVHRDGDIHGTSHVWVVREREEGGLDLLLQKRSADKESFPGCYDISSAGHIPAGQDFLPSAVRELEEELGIRAQEEDLIYLGVQKGCTKTSFYGKPFYNQEIAKVYLYNKPVQIDQLTLQKEEVESVKWMDLGQCFEKVWEKDPEYILYEQELDMVEKWFRENKREKTV